MVIKKYLLIIIILLTRVSLVFSQEIELVIPLGHSDKVTSVEYSPNEKTILTTSEDGAVKIWDSEKGWLLHTLKNSSFDIFNSAEYSPDGLTILTALEGGTIKIWNSETGKVLHTILAHDGFFVYSAKYSYDGKYIVSASNDGTAKIWDVNTQKLLYTLKCQEDDIYSAKYSPDNKTIITSSEDGTAKIWDAKGNLLYTIEGYIRKIHSANYSPDSKYIVTASSDETAKIWDVETGELLYTLSGHDGEVLSANYSPDGKTIITTSTDNTAKLWDAESGKLLNTFDEHNGTIYSAKYSYDGKYIVSASADKTAKIWNVETGELLHTFNGHTKDVKFAIFNSKSTKIVTASFDKTAKIWNIKNEELLYTLEGFTDFVNSAEYSPDGEKILTSFKSGIAKVWNAKTGKLLHNLIGHSDVVNSAKYSPDGKIILTVSDDKTAKIWNAETGELLHTLTRHDDDVNTVNFNKLGDLIITSSNDETARIWDSETGELLRTFTGHTDIVNSAKFSPDETEVLTYSDDETVKIWSVEEGILLRSFSVEGGIYSAEYNNTGDYIIAVGYKYTKIWNAKTGALVNYLEGIFSAEYSPDGQSVVTLSEDGNVRICDAKIKNVRYSLKGFKDPVLLAQYSIDGKNILTTSGNGTTKVWDAKTGNLLFKFKGYKGLYSNFSYSPNKNTIVTTTIDGSFVIWNAITGKMLVRQFVFNKKNKLALSTEGYFDGDPEAIKQLYFVKGLETIPLESYYEQFYRPSLWSRIISNKKIEKTKFAFQEQKPICEIEITNPSIGEIAFRSINKANLSTNQKEFNLVFNVIDNGGGINEVRIFQNDKLIFSSKENVNNKGQKIDKTYKLNLLQGNNNIKIVAFNNDRIEKQETCIIKYTGDIQEPANLYVLTIGINDYKKSQYNLNYAQADADAIKDALQVSSKEIFSNIEIINLRNDQASNLSIKRVIAQIQAKAKQSDVFVFYYAGHGAMSVVDKNEQSMFFLIPYDVTNLYSDVILKSKGISANELKTFSEKIKAQKQLFILDACQSGGALNLIASRGALEEKAMAILARSTGTYWLTATGSEQLAGEFGALGHGVFTYALLRALSGEADANNDGKVSVAELSFYIDNSVPRLSKKYKGKSQYPAHYGFGQDFPVALSGKYDVGKEPKSSIQQKTDNNHSNKSESKYAKYNIDELKKMKTKAVEVENYDLAKELKIEIEKRK